jgi:hypothetical protein
MHGAPIRSARERGSPASGARRHRDARTIDRRIERARCSGREAGLSSKTRSLGLDGHLPAHPAHFRMDHRIGTCAACGARYRIPSNFTPNQARCRACSGVVHISPGAASNAAPRSASVGERRGNAARDRRESGERGARDSTRRVDEAPAPSTPPLATAASPLAADADLRSNALDARELAASANEIATNAADRPASMTERAASMTERAASATERNASDVEHGVGVVASDARPHGDHDAAASARIESRRGDRTRGDEHAESRASVAEPARATNADRRRPWLVAGAVGIALAGAYLWFVLHSERTTSAGASSHPNDASPAHVETGASAPAPPTRNDPSSRGH